MGNMIMQELTGVTFPITAVLSLIKTQPPKRISTEMFLNYSLGLAAHCVVILILNGTLSKMLKQLFSVSLELA